MAAAGGAEDAGGAEEELPQADAQAATNSSIGTIVRVLTYIRSSISPRAETDRSDSDNKADNTPGRVAPAHHC